jgi:hypothetical protein
MRELLFLYFKIQTNLQPLQKIPKKMGRPRKTEILPLEEQAENKLIPEPAMAIPQAAEV